MTAKRPPQITENEAHIWQDLGRAANAAEEASLALARAQQRLGREETIDTAWWRLVADMLRLVGNFASETLAARQRAARTPEPDPSIPGTWPPDA